VVSSNLRLDLANAGFDVLLLAGAVDDRALLLLDDDLLGAPEHRRRHVLELDAEVLRDQLAAGEDRDVLEHGLAAVAEARSLHRRDLEPPRSLLTPAWRAPRSDVLGDDQQRLARLHHRLEHWQHGLQARELLLVQQDEDVLRARPPSSRIGDEVGREIAGSNCMPSDDLDLGVERLGLPRR